MTRSSNSSVALVIASCLIVSGCSKGKDSAAQSERNLKPPSSQSDATVDAAQQALEVGDYATAFKELQPLAKHGTVSAQYMLGDMYYHGRGVTQNYKAALQWYRLAAEQGDAHSQYNLGIMYDNGQGVRQDDNEAIRWYKLAAEKGYAAAQFDLGVCYANGEGVPQDDKAAARWFRLAADQGYAAAQFNLGLMFSAGRGVSQDSKEAARWYRSAAEQGLAVAQFNLGGDYANGRGVGQDYKEAARWYRLAAEQGLAVAQFNLALMFSAGHGVPQDSKEAARWYRLAAEQGLAVAQFNLGVDYYKGRGVGQNYEEAAQWYRLAAAQGQGEAQLNLGIMYASGEGIPRDNVQAYMWFSLASASGVMDGFKVRDIVAQDMTPMQIADAERLARKWKPNTPMSPAEDLLLARQQPEAAGKDAVQADYPQLLSTVASRVEQELPTMLPSDLFAPLATNPLGEGSRHLDSDGQAIPPFLLLSVDLIQLPKDGKGAGILGGFGIKAIRQFLENGLDFGGRRADPFLILSNFPVLENHESLFFDLIRNNKNRAARVGAVLALRNDVFDQGLVCQFLSTLLNDRDKDVQYAAMLALATSDQLTYLRFQMADFPTDGILSEIDQFTHTEFQVKMVIPLVRVLSRSPYIRNPKVHKLRENLRDVTPTDPAEKKFYEECLQIIDAAK